MRDYLYIWNDPREQFVVASGMSFACPVALDWTVGWSSSIPTPGCQTSATMSSGTQRATCTTCVMPTLRDSPRIRAFHAAISAGLLCGREPAWVPDHEVAELLSFSHSERPLTGLPCPVSGTDTYATVTTMAGSWAVPILWRMWPV